MTERESPPAEPLPGGGTAQALARLIDPLVAAYDAPTAPGAVVAVLRRDRPRFVRTCGAARLEARGPVPVTPETRFRLASITKQLTAQAVADLVREGKLSLDTPIGERVPGLPGWGGGVRVGHLVAHTSGLPEYEAMIPVDRVRPLDDREVVDLLATAPTLRFPPGSRFDYSNGGYALLAVLLEEVSGRTFTEVLEERIFRPLGMAGAVAHVEGRTVVNQRAYGYRAAGRGWEDADQSVTSAVLGDGGVYASALELARWDAALHSPGYAPDPADLAPYASSPDEGTDYGFGWYLDRFRGRPRQRHDGWTSGFQNEIQRFPDAGLTVVALTNRAEPPVRALVEAIAGRLLPPEAPDGRW